MAGRKTSRSQKNKEHEKYALLSVYDKTGIIEFAKALTTLHYKIISTGGTAKTLTTNNIPVISIEQITGNPESFDGRMKTISFQVESGILFDRTNKLHAAQARDLKIKPIDIVVCNLYPFEQTIQNPNVTPDEAIENIDVGGPTMIRAAGKNFKNVVVVVDPKDYSVVTNALEKKIVTNDLRQELAAKAFLHLSFYDSQIGNYFKRENFPAEITFPGRKVINLRYGENPHQAAAIYTQPNSESPLQHLKQLAGRDLSLVNVTDINAGLESVRFFKNPAAVVIKHNSPCGIALGDTASQALERALDADPESAFGGIVVLNKPMNLQAAKVIEKFKKQGRGNMDIIAATAVDPKALELLKTVRKTTGVYEFGKIPRLSKKRMNFKWIDEGFILQTSDDDLDKGFKKWEVVTRKKPSAKQISQMKFAWIAMTRIRSNAIIVVDKTIPMTRGIGSGQTSRVRSTKIALEQAGIHVKGAILASDSFFPFDDSVRLAAKYAIGAIIQQGDSINDKASIAAADELGIPMVLTHRRAFWH